MNEQVKAYIAEHPEAEILFAWVWTDAYVDGISRAIDVRNGTDTEPLKNPYLPQEVKAA